MRNANIIFFILISISLQVSAQKKEINKLEVILDQGLVMKWDNSQNSWTEYGKQKYYYSSDGKIDSVITSEINIGLPTGRTIYIYKNSGYLSEYTSEVYRDQGWEYIRKYVINTDEYGKVVEQLVFDFESGGWEINRRQYHYTYEDGKNTGFWYQRKTEDGWANYRNENYFYNSDGLLTYSISKTIEDIISGQVFYGYNQNGLRINMLVQGWSTTGQYWFNSYRNLYEYNKCGKRVVSVRQRFIDNEWVNESKTEYIYGIENHNLRKGKVAICHNGKSLYVSINAVNAHLKHGDCLGECIEEDNQHRYRKRNEEYDDQENYDKVIPFKVYPNPARDNITIKLKDQYVDCFKHVELLDAYGKVLRQIDTMGKHEVTMNRGSLKSGNYYLRIKGEEAFSIVVIFK